MADGLRGGIAESVYYSWSKGLPLYRQAPARRRHGAGNCDDRWGQAAQARGAGPEGSSRRAGARVAAAQKTVWRARSQVVFDTMV